MTAKNGCDDFKGGKERLLDLAKLSLEELLYYVLVELRGKGPDAVVA